MTDFPVGHSQSAKSVERTAAAFARLIALFRTAFGVRSHAIMPNVRRRAMRRTPEEILMEQVRREEARRAVDRLLLLR